jgi:general stress protein 26
LALKVWGGRHLTGEETESLLREAKTARFCSLNDDGTIHAAPVWFKYEQGKIVIITPACSTKVGNVKRNKDVTVLIDVGGPSRGVLIYGEAVLEELDNEIKLKQTYFSMCEKYMSKEEAEDKFSYYLPMTTNWAKITVKPERIASFWYPE